MVSTLRPYLSVVMPAHNGKDVLPHSLGALLNSDMDRERWELVVVDDASRDETCLVAARYADAVVRLPGQPRGPAYARNRGFEASSGEVVVFIDADVCVHPETLSQFASIFAERPEVSAVFGSYDSHPVAPGLVSQYRNLMHHYVHHQHPGDAETFWAGCGAIRSTVFTEVGKFDEWHFPRPQIEDIELGHRIRVLGHRILLRPEIQGTHLKQWNLRNVVLTDIRERGVPWMRLLLHEGRATKMKALNLRTVEKLNTALVGLALVSLAVAAFRRDPRWLGGLLLLLIPILTNLSLYRFFRRERGVWFMVCVSPLHLMYYMLNVCSALVGYLLYHTVGAPVPAPEVQAFAEVGVKTWPPVPAKLKGSRWFSD